MRRYSDDVRVPSIGALAYQAQSLVDALAQIEEHDYPPEACAIRDVVSTLAEELAAELAKATIDFEKSRTDKQAALIIERAILIGEVIHKMFAVLRYLRAAAPSQTPPAIQAAVTYLTNRFFPKENGLPVCLVRPQWSYNLRCVLLNERLPQMMTANLIRKKPDRIKEFPAFAQVAWREKNPKSRKQDAPRQLAIVSFAGLDTDDVLLFPILAHEIAHFIDHSYMFPVNARRDRLPLRFQGDSNDIAKETETELMASQWAKDVTKKSTSTTTLRVGETLREVLADLVAVRMLGPAYFLAIAEMLKTTKATASPKELPVDVDKPTLARAWDAPFVDRNLEKPSYPTMAFRIALTFRALEDSPFDVIDFLEKHAEADDGGMLNLFQKWKKVSDETWERMEGELKREPASFNDLTLMLPFRIAMAHLEDLRALAARAIPDSRVPRLSPAVFQRIDQLKKDIPPSLPKESPDAFAEIMFAGWGYQLQFGDDKETAKGPVASSLDEYRKTCRLVLKAVELVPEPTRRRTRTTADRNPIAQSISEVLSGGKVDITSTGVLAGPNIVYRTLCDLDDPQRLGVVPFDPRNVKGASLDLRLGNRFAVARTRRLPYTPLFLKDLQDPAVTRGVDRYYVRTNRPFVIHPGSFVLGVTLEFLAIPKDTIAFVEGRSGLGREGLIVATAAQVAPGFHGVIVLELANVGTVPLEVVPGMTVAQLVLEKTTELVPEDLAYRSKYYCQIEP